MSIDAQQLVVVSLGTDHHRFDRLMTWIERWIASTPPADARVVVQHGPSRCPAGAEGHALLPRERLLELMQDASAIVVQGGPGGIMDSLSVGRKPIVVPRIGALKEAVDDHQVPFARHLASLDRVVLAENEPDLRRDLTLAVASPDSFRARASTEHVERTVERFDELISQMMGNRRPRRSLPAQRLPR